VPARRRRNPIPLGLAAKFLLSPAGPLLPPPPDLTTWLLLRHRKRQGRANPGGRHLPRATPKDNRMYSHIKAAELARGAPLREAKSIAAATVRAYQKRRRGRRRR
jgi:hypothetical protein